MSSNSQGTQPLWRGGLLPAAVLALLVTAVYLAFPSRLYFGEGFKWALSEPSEHGGLFRFFHPHHLLYNPLGYLLHHVLALLRPGLSPMISFRLLDTAAGLGGVLVFHHLLRRLLRDGRLAWAAAAGFAFSWGYWTHGINVEVYAVSVFFLVVGFSIAERAVRDDAAGWGTWCGLGFTAGAAVLFHQSNVLFLAVPLAAAFFHPRGRGPGLARFARGFVPAYAATTVLPYLAVMIHLGFRSSHAALTWLFLYGHQTDTYVGTDASVVTLALISFVRMLLLPSTYTSAFADPLVSPPLLLVLKWSAAVLLGLLVLAAAGNIRRLRRHHGPVLRLAVALAVPYVLFFTFWDPGGYFFWLPLGITFWLTVGCAAASLPPPRWSRAGPLLLGLAVAALFAVNFAGGVLPESRFSRVDDHRLMGTVTGLVDAGDLVLLNSPRMDRLSNFGGPLFYGYSRAFGRFETFCLYPALEAPELRRELDRRVADALGQGLGVWYLDEVLGGRGTTGGRGGSIREAFDGWGLRTELAAAHPGGDAYGGSMLYRLVEVPPGQ